MLPPHLFGPPPPQYSAPAQDPPQSRRWPQPSPAGPQSYPSAAQVVGVHRLTAPPSAATKTLPPHLFAPPPPQYCPAGHAAAPPQLSELPHPSPPKPQS